MGGFGPAALAIRWAAWTARGADACPGCASQGARPVLVNACGLACGGKVRSSRVGGGANDGGGTPAGGPEGGP
jgi:hypothetical protein